MNRLRIVFREPLPDGTGEVVYRTPAKVPGSPLDARELIRILNQTEDRLSEVALGFPIENGFVMYPAGIIHHIELMTDPNAEDKSDGRD